MPLQNDDFPTKISELDQIVQNEKIPNALLFTGNPGAGKKQTALRFAKAVNCDTDTLPLPCNRCRSCRKIDNRMHPDMIFVDLVEPKKVITISQIREAVALTAVKSNEARYRMVLISHAGHMNTQAQNALLKELEEPPENTFFVLTARDTAMLLPTIKSRCRHLRFNPPTGRVLAEHLCESHQVDIASARIVAMTSGSDPGLARELVDWQAKRPWLIHQVCLLMSRSFSRKIEAALALSWQLSLNPDGVLPGLAVIKTFFRDLFVARHAPEKILNLDFSDTFQDIGSRVTDETCLSWMTELHETERRLASNSSMRMTLDRFFLKVIDI